MRAKRARDAPEPEPEVLQPDNWPYGSRFMVYNVEYKAWYLGQIVRRKKMQGADLVSVRYAGWDKEHDEWINVMSDRFDVQAGGRRRWKPIAGAAGAFMRLDGGALPTGSVVQSWPAAPGNLKLKLKATEQADCEVVLRHKPNAKGDKASADHAVIRSIRAFGAAKVEWAPGLEDPGVSQAGAIGAAAGRGEAGARPAADRRYSRRLPRGEEQPSSCPGHPAWQHIPELLAASQQAAAGPSPGEDAGVQGGAGDGTCSNCNQQPATEPPVSGEAPHGPPAPADLSGTAAQDHSARPSEERELGKGTDGSRRSSSSRECSSKGERHRKSSRPTQVAPVHYSGGGPLGSRMAGRGGDAVSAAAGVGVEQLAASRDEEDNAAAAGSRQQQHVFRTLGGHARAPRPPYSLRVPNPPQSSAGPVPGTGLSSVQPPRNDVLWRVVELARKQQLALEWTLLQLDTLLREQGSNPTSPPFPSHLEAPPPAHPGESDVWRECQHLEVICTWLQQAIGRRIRRLKQSGAAQEPLNPSAAANRVPAHDQQRLQMQQMQLDLAPVLAAWQSAGSVNLL